MPRLLERYVFDRRFRRTFACLYVWSLLERYGLDRRFRLIFVVCSVCVELALTIRLQSSVPAYVCLLRMCRACFSDTASTVSCGLPLLSAPYVWSLL
ncbi:hypothetical protein [Bacteroides pyogenes]|uniref:hypothetical protein n=1 Tax=Bacteroides pyogenes TaxID=310300 RepID=UPI00242AFE96